MLISAKLVGADASFTDLSEVLLMPANLSHVNLLNTEFRAADLIEVILTGTRLDQERQTPLHPTRQASFDPSSYVDGPFKRPDPPAPK